jgi:sugar lactone lactonase YvrE
MKRISLTLIIFIFIVLCSYSPAWAGSGSYTETFSTTAYNDAANTNANWSTAEGLAKLPKPWTPANGTWEGHDAIRGSRPFLYRYIMRLDSSGNPCILFTGYYKVTSWTENDLYFTRWNGSAWTKADKVTPGYDNLTSINFERLGDLRLDASDYPIIVWQGGNGEDQIVYFSRWNGSAWTYMDGTTGGYENISGPNGSVGNVSLKLDPSGKPCVAFYKDIIYGSGTNNEIMFTHWDGSSWRGLATTEARDNLTNDASQEYSPIFALDSNGYPNMIWQDYRDYSTGKSEIYFSKWNGTAWTTAENISHTQYECYPNDIKMDSSDRPYVIWTDNQSSGSNPQIFFTHWNGTAWKNMAGTATTEMLSQGSGWMYSLTDGLRMINNTNPCVIWGNNSSGNYDVYFRKWNGSNWTYMDGTTVGCENISNNSSYSEMPGFELDSQGYPHIIWIDNLPGNYEIYFTKWNGSAWTKADGLTAGYENISKTSAASGSIPNSGSWPPQVIPDAQGKINAVWLESNGTIEGWLYFSKYTGKYIPSAKAQSLKINSSGTVTQAQLTVTEDKPTNTSIAYSLSANGGGTWESVTPGDLYIFNTRGLDLRWKADLTTTDTASTSAVDTLALSYYTAPNPPTIGTPDVLGKTKVRWKFTDNSTDETGFRTYSTHGMHEAALTNLTSIEESDLTANISYSAYAVAYNTYGESVPSAASAWVYTLPVSPDATCDRALSTWYGPGTTYKFTNAAAWGAGSVDHYHYVWNQSPTYSFSGSEDMWNTGTKEMSPSGDGSYYMHLLSHNPAQVSGGNKDIGPYQYDGIAPSAPQSLIATPDSWTKTNNFTLNWTNPSDASGIIGAYYKLDTAPTSNTDGTYVDPVYKFLMKWGGPGGEDGKLNQVYRVAVDPSGNVYAVDYGNKRVQKFDSNGNFITKWGSSGSGDGQFGGAVGIAVDPSGQHVYVADSYNYRIQKFTSSGTFEAKWGSSGTGDGQFNTPHGVAVDPSGKVYVADTLNRRIQKFSSIGTFEAKWGSSGMGDGQFQFPSGIAADTSGNIYVADTNNCRIQKSTSDGTFLGWWGLDNKGFTGWHDPGSGRFGYYSGSAEGQFNGPRGVYVDTSGHIYVADTLNHRIQKFTAYATFEAKWGSRGSGDGQFYEPYQATVDPSGNVYVADSLNNRIQKFNLGCTQAGGITVTGDGTHDAHVWLKDNAGNLNYTNRATANLKLDTTAPTNPTTCDGWSDKNKTTGISSGGTYDYNNPYFEWSNASDTASGVAGYYVYYGTSGAADPATAGAYQDPVSYEVTSPMTPGQTYHLRIKAKDNAGNTATNTYEAFSYNKLLSESSYTTKVGSNEEWVWRTAQTGEAVPSGSAEAWQWLTWEAGSGRKVPSGEAHDWMWGEE